MKWVTTANVHFDRVASPWLITRFIDPKAEFIFLSRDQMDKRPADAIPIAIPGTELGPHDENGTTFTKLVKKYQITDPAIVAAAELSHRYITDRFLPDKAIDLIDEAASRIKMEIDSKPEAMDKLDRRLIQLKIEREAVKKEKDEASQKRLGLIEDEIKTLEREYADLEEIWKAEKAQVQGSAHVKEEIDRIRADIVKLQREGKLDKVAELQYGKLPQLESQLKQAEKASTGEVRHKLLRTQVGAEEIAEVEIGRAHV